MKKAFILLVILVIIALVAFFLFFKQVKPIAVLNIEQGEVQIKTTNDWTQAQNGMEILKNTVIKTGSNSKASIIFFTNNIIRLDENTEISINELISKTNLNKVSITQNIGQTWTKIIKLSGVETDYKIQTPTAIASVRGTAFSLKVTRDESLLRASQGKVDLSSYKTQDNKKIILDTKEVKKSEKVTVDKGSIDQPITIENIIDETDWEKENKEKDAQFLKEARAKRMLQGSLIIRQIQKQENLTIEELVELLEKYEKGEIELKIFTEEEGKLQELTKKQVDELIEKTRQEEIEE